MIVIDTSALIALLKNERDATACRESLKEANEIAISASTLTEALIVSAGQKLREEMVELISSVVTTTFDVTSLRAAHAAAAYSRWGKGIHPAGLNFGDCFAYARRRTGLPAAFCRRRFRTHGHTLRHSPPHYPTPPTKSLN